MIQQPLSRTTALRKITEGIDALLSPAGFEPHGRSSWVRCTAELQHVIALLARRGTYDVQWGVVSPEAVPYLWGTPPELGDVGGAVMSGTPGTIHHPPARQSFRLDAEGASVDAVDLIAGGLSSDLERVQRRILAFSTRKELRDYLMLNRDAKDRRDFILPANLPLKLFVAAVLALVDEDPAALGLAQEAERAMGRFTDELSVARLQRLREGCSRLSHSAGSN